MNIRIETNTNNPENSTLTVEGSVNEINEAFTSITNLPESIGKVGKEEVLREFLAKFPFSCRPNKIAVIKAVRSVTRLGLKEAKNLVEDIWD